MNPRLRSSVLVVGLIFSGCSTWPPEGWRQFKTPCGMTVYQRLDSDINEDDVVELERRLVQFVSPLEGVDACNRLNNNFAHELDGNMTELQPDLYVAGWAECWNRRLFYHRGQLDDGARKPWNTALWHEMIHIAQGCYTKETPPDDENHPHWTDRGYWSFPQEFWR